MIETKQNITANEIHCYLHTNKIIGKTVNHDYNIFLYLLHSPMLVLTVVTSLRADSCNSLTFSTKNGATPIDDAWSTAVSVKT